MFPYSSGDENDELTEERHSGVRAISNLHLNWELIIEYDIFLRLNLLGKATMNKRTLLNILLNWHRKLSPLEYLKQTNDYPINL